jgi:protein-S-isoprenylcysteine O-methyltransferase Ste14
MTRFERLFVWSGGAVFVFALAVCAYAYGIAWTRPAPFSPGAVAWNSLLLTLFAGHHSLFARERVKSWLAKALPEHVIRSVYVWTASVLLLLAVLLWRPVGGELYRVAGWPRAAHAAIQAAGLWIVARSVRAIDALELAGIRQRTDEPLQTAGPYRWVRHPLYLGWLLVTFGAWQMTGDRLLFAGITAFYLILAIPWEERSLMRSFDGQYADYKRRVPWRLVPYIY